ncbi:unnamed protein product [Diabrotica balteata]|uniref:Uncharacterized protein n=1 Tax=Diabrotica balteata TaxID=107213 RepID=A0A9N9SMM9_DIABA|nr:unnamed protein product [Diabrotica balteata]
MTSLLKISLLFPLLLAFDKGNSLECYTCIASRYEHNRCQSYTTKGSLPVSKCHGNSTHCVSFFNDDIVARICGTARTCDETNSIECHLCTESYCNFHYMYRRRYIRQAPENNATTTAGNSTVETVTATTVINATTETVNSTSSNLETGSTNSSEISSTITSNNTTSATGSPSAIMTSTPANASTALLNSSSTTSNFGQTTPKQEDTNSRAASILFQSIFTTFIIVCLLFIF